MLTTIERSYLDQGYVLPEPLTWDEVAERRAHWRIDPIYVPVAIAPGCLACGWPSMNGTPQARHSGAIATGT